MNRNWGPSLLALPRDVGSWMPVLAGVIMLWGLSFEIDRALERAAPLPGCLAAFGPLQLKLLLLIALWAVGGAIMFGMGMRRRRPALFGAGVTGVALTGIVWLTGGTIAWRFFNDPSNVMPVLNVQFAIGALCGGLLAWTATAVRSVHHAARACDDAAPVPVNGPSSISHRLNGASLTALLFALAGAVGLWLGSIELDRVFAGTGVQQASLSVWWALYAVAIVVLGFAKRLAPVRYLGLALLALTTAKVLAVDFATLKGLPRVLSSAGAGLLLVMTSVVYARLSPVLLGEINRVSAGGRP